MGKLVILGSANAVPGVNQENTHFYVEAGKRNILVDCGSNPLQVLPGNGIQPNALTDIIITHFHPDHVSGLPLLLMDLWLMGRREPIAIYANQHALSRIEKMMLCKTDTLICRNFKDKISKACLLYLDPASIIS